LKYGLKPFHPLIFFELIDSNKFDVFSRNFPEKQFNSLINNYRGFFNIERLKTELQLTFGNSPTVSEMIEFIYKNDIITDVPEIYKLFCLIVSLPPTSA
jgi:hypothetical protein